MEHRQVSVRLLLPSAGDDERKPLLREAKLLRDFDGGEGYPRLHYAGHLFETECLYTICEHVPGIGLVEALKKLDPIYCLELLCKVGATIDVLHKSGYTHGALTPDILVVTPAGEIALVDLRLCRKDGESRSAQRFTPYIAPESMRESKAAPTADVYSIAAIFYRGLTDTSPYNAKTIRVPGKSPRGPSELNPRMSSITDKIFLKALHREPTLRHPDARSLLEELNAALGDATLLDSHPSSFIPMPLLLLKAAAESVRRGILAMRRIPASARGHRTRFIVASVAVLTILSAGVVSLIVRPQYRPVPANAAAPLSAVTLAVLEPHDVDAETLARVQVLTWPAGYVYLDDQLLTDTPSTTPVQVNPGTYEVVYVAKRGDQLKRMHTFEAKSVYRIEVDFDTQRVRLKKEP